MIKTIQHANEVKRKIFDRIRAEIEKGNDRLPAEAELAEEFSASRTLVRDCLDSLEQEGYVTRLHGVGTLINAHVVEAEDRLDIDKDFLKAVSDAGYRASLLDLTIGQTTADVYLSQVLEIAAGTPLVTISRVIGADDVPAIYCVDYFEKELIKEPEYRKTDFAQSSYRYLIDVCGIEIHMDIADIQAALSDEKLSAVFGIEKGTPLLNMIETGYDFFGKPRMYSTEYYREGVLKHFILRKKLVS